MIEPGNTTEGLEGLDSREEPAMTTTPITMTLDLSWPEQARTGHLQAHDDMRQHGWTADNLETLRVTWHRDCPHCPRPGRRGALGRWQLRRAIARHA